jgi:hypothetical protein
VQTLLFIKANPIDTADLRLEKEENNIRDALQKSEHRKNFDIEARGAITTEYLLEYLVNVKPNILHIAGHGGSNDSLFLEDKDGRKDEISISRFSNLLENFLEHLDCVFLNSCHSLSDISDLSDEIPFIIGMKKEIADEVAINFSTAFYTALFNGRSTPDSFEIALDMISLKALEDEQIPRLIINSKKLDSKSEEKEERDLVSEEEILMAKKQNKRKVKFYNTLMVALIITGVAAVALLLIFKQGTLAALGGGGFPLGLMRLPFQEAKIYKECVDLIELFELKRNRQLAAYTRLSEKHIKNLNKDFVRIISLKTKSWTK